MRWDGAVGTAITSSAVPGMKGSQLRASLVNRFVNQTRRNRLRQGRRIGPEPEVAAQPYRGQQDDWRLPETAETCVVWLITQRSRVQIPPPLPRPEALSRTEKGPSACSSRTIVRPAMSCRDG